MELKVYINKNIRIVCGIHKHTTVQDVIISLAQSMQQTGCFYLIENIRNLNMTKTSKSNFGSEKQHISRVMSPNETLVNVLSNHIGCLERNQDIEFHLIRSNLSNMSNKEEIMRDLMCQIDHLRYAPESTCESILNQTRSSCNEGEDSSTHISPNSSEICLINTLLSEIYIQKQVLDGQSTKLDELVKKIKVNEEIKDQMEIENNAYLQRLNQLEKVYSVNRSKILELEKETNENILKKEIELNELLKRQRDNYKLRLEEIFMELKQKCKLLSDLQSKYKLLQSYQEQTDNEMSRLNTKISESKKESLINQKKLESLKRDSDNLDEYFVIRKIELEMIINHSEEESSITSSIDFTSTQSNFYPDNQSIFYF